MSRLSILVLIFVCGLYGCKYHKQKEDQMITLINWKPAHDYYIKNISDAIDYLDTLSTLDVSSYSAKEYFQKARISFKKAEPFVSYLNPEVGHRANGPALPSLTDDSQKVLDPIGLQKIEESIYEGEDETVYKEELRLTRGLFEILKGNSIERDLNPSRFFIATHQQLMRILSFGITGFDTPVSELGLSETQISLNSLLQVYKLSLQSLVEAKDSDLNAQFEKQINEAVAFIESNKNFATFDRYTFLRDYFNPITRSWVKIRKTIAVWEPATDQAFNYDAPTFFEEDSFNVDNFRAVNTRKPSEAQIALGERLFYDTNLSQSKGLACVTCHSPQKAYTDGLVTNLNNVGGSLKRNSPTLINSIFQRGFFWDGRAGSLLAQISGVFTNKEEFNTAIHEFSDEVLNDSTYYDAFSQVYGTTRKWTNNEVIKSLSAYISTLNSFDSKFDKNMRGEENSFTSEEKQGMNLFMGKALCATCHFMPLTGGTVPPFFTDTEKEVIGVPETAANATLDDDTGFYFMYEEPIQFGMFKTPTVRNAAVTAPYMHNGVYATLEEVMDFYNKGGGAGLGFDLPHQTLPFDNLQLSPAEINSLVAFIETLTSVPATVK